MKTQQLTSVEPDRVETGPVKFGDDWTGVFIRGDDAFALWWDVKQGNTERILALLKSADEAANRAASSRTENAS